MKDKEPNVDDPEILLAAASTYSHLTTPQRAAFALALLPEERELARKRMHVGKAPDDGHPTQGVADQPAGAKGEATERAGARMGVSRETVRKAMRIAESAPEVIEVMRSGLLRSMPEAMRLAALPATLRSQVIDTMRAEVLRLKPALEAIQGKDDPDSSPPNESQAVPPTRSADEKRAAAWLARGERLLADARKLHPFLQKESLEHLLHETMDLLDEFEPPPAASDDEDGDDHHEARFVPRQDDEQGTMPPEIPEVDDDLLAMLDEDGADFIQGPIEDGAAALIEEAGIDPDRFSESPPPDAENPDDDLVRRAELAAWEFRVPFQSSNLADKLGCSYQQATWLLKRLHWPREDTLLGDGRRGIRWVPQQFDRDLIDDRKHHECWDSVHDDDKKKVWAVWGHTVHRSRQRSN